MTNIITDAELVSQYAQKAMEEPEKTVVTRAPSDSIVDLPGGFITPTGEVIRTAEVRELTGADEEAIAKSGSRSKAMQVLLQRGLVRLGDKEPTKEDIDNLLSGDRDAILLGIRRITFGPTLEIDAICGMCRENQSCVVHLVDDVPVKELADSAEDRTWSIDTRGGEVVIGLPTGVVQKKLMENADKTVPEINTLLLSGCVLSVDGRPSMGASTALQLGMVDREKIIDSIIERNPGPRLGEVTKSCRACGEDIPLPFGLLDLFRL